MRKTRTARRNIYGGTSNVLLCFQLLLAAVGTIRVRQVGTRMSASCRLAARLSDLSVQSCCAYATTRVFIAHTVACLKPFGNLLLYVLSS